MKKVSRIAKATRTFINSRLLSSLERLANTSDPVPWSFVLGTVEIEVTGAAAYGFLLLNLIEQRCISSYEMNG